MKNKKDWLKIGRVVWVMNGHDRIVEPAVFMGYRRQIPFVKVAGKVWQSHRLNIFKNKKTAQRTLLGQMVRHNHPADVLVYLAKSLLPRGRK